MKKKSIDPIKDAVKTLRDDIEELESNFETLNFENTSKVKKLKSIADRITNSAKRVQILVKDNTYSP